jgi:hypothetical protein
VRSGSAPGSAGHRPESHSLVPVGQSASQSVSQSVTLYVCYFVRLGTSVSTSLDFAPQQGAMHHLLHSGGTLCCCKPCNDLVRLLLQMITATGTDKWLHTLVDMTGADKWLHTCRHNASLHDADRPKRTKPNKNCEVHRAAVAPQCTVVFMIPQSRS